LLLLPTIHVIHTEAATTDQLTTTTTDLVTVEDTPTPEEVTTPEEVVTTAITTEEQVVTIITTEGLHTTATDLYTEYLTTLSTNNSGKFKFYTNNI